MLKEIVGRMESGNEATAGKKEGMQMITKEGGRDDERDRKRVLERTVSCSYKGPSSNAVQILFRVAA